MKNLENFGLSSALSIHVEDSYCSSGFWEGLLIIYASQAKYGSWLCCLSWYEGSCGVVLLKAGRSW